MSNDEFLDAFGDARIAEAAATEPDPQTVREALPTIIQAEVTEGLMTQDQANAALLDRGIITAGNAPTPEQLRAMPDDVFMDTFGAAMTSASMTLHGPRLEQASPPAGCFPPTLTLA